MIIAMTMKKSYDYWNVFLYGSFIGMLAGIGIGFLMCECL